MRPYSYILDENNEPVPVDIEQWVQWLEWCRIEAAKVGKQLGATLPILQTFVDLDKGEEKIFVSTVFLGLDRSLRDAGPPILFETMIFGGGEDEYQRRYSTFDDALVGHAETVAMVSDL